MPQRNEPQREEKKVLTGEEIDFQNKDLQEKYDELMESAEILQTEKLKWKATFDEFEDFYNNAPCGYYTTDDSGLILKINQTYLNWLGYKREEVVNKMNIMNLLSEKSLVLFYKYMPLLREKGLVDQVEVEYKRKNGAILSALVSARAIFDEQDNFKCVRSTAWDISDRKKMEDEMLKVNRHLHAIKERFDEKNTLAQKLNEELQLMKQDQSELYKTLHERIGQPLERLSALCSTLNVPGASPESLRKIQERIADVKQYLNSVRLQQLVSAESHVLDSSLFNLSRLLVTVVNRLDELAGKKRLTINCEIFEDLVIRSDREVLAQVVDTLLMNVINLSYTGKEIPLRLIKKVNQFVVELEISGLSISREELAILFDKNKQEQQASTAKGAEIALNSRLINSLVEQLGFSLTVSPVNHKGTVIRLAIPASFAA